MWNIFKNNNRDNEGAKKLIMREFFNSAEQKKAVKKAARESVKDQEELLEKYKEMKLNKICQ